MLATRLPNPPWGRGASPRNATLPVISIPPSLHAKMKIASAKKWINTLDAKSILKWKLSS